MLWPRNVVVVQKAASALIEVLLPVVVKDLIGF